MSPRNEPSPPGCGYARLWWTAIIAVTLDQASKRWILAAVPLGANPADGGLIPVIPDFFYIIHVYNTGAAWGLFAGYPQALGWLGILALAAIFFFRRQLELQRPYLQLVYGLLVGGIVGNVIDRFAYGHVVDFLDFHFGSYRYPAFNVADSAITVGVALYIGLGLWESWQEKRTRL